MTTFIPNSSFSRHALRTALESRGAYITIQFLNVPEATPGDRSTWTWANNWGLYAIPGAYSSGLDALQLLSTGGGTGVLELWAEATSPDPGAYYANTIYGTPLVGYTNNGLSDITFTHVAVFTMQTDSPVTDPETALSDEFLAYVYPYNKDTEAADTLPAGERYYNFIGGALHESNFASFDDWVDADEAITLDIINSGGLYTYPYLNSSYIFKIGDEFVGYGYYNNTQTKQYFNTLHQYLLEISGTRTNATFLAELLNVTGTEPDFDAGWSGWETYRINRYAFTAAETAYKYENKEGSWLLDLGLIDPELSGTYLETVWTGQQVSFLNPCEFVFTAPTSSSYTFTHIAIFINEGSSAPQQGTTYTYTDTDRFVGVIAVPSSVTMTTSSTARAYPFNLAVMYQPTSTYVEL